MDVASEINIPLIVVMLLKAVLEPFIVLKLPPTQYILETLALDPLILLNDPLIIARFEQVALEDENERHVPL